MAAFVPEPVSASSRTIQLLATRPTKDAHTYIRFLKEEVVEFAGQNVFEKAIIQLTPEDSF